MFQHIKYGHRQADALATLAPKIEVPGEAIFVTILKGPYE